MGDIPAYLTQRLAYLGFGDDDRERLAELRPLLEQHAPAFVAAFYRHLLSFQPTRELLRDPAVKERLLKAYFTDNRDITAEETLRAIWEEAELPPDGLARSEQPEILRQVLDEHNEAVECGANGVPAFRSADNEAVITGAQPIEVFRNWVNRLLDRGDG